MYLCSRNAASSDTHHAKAVSVALIAIYPQTSRSFLHLSHLVRPLPSSNPAFAIFLLQSSSSSIKQFSSILPSILHRVHCEFNNQFLIVLARVQYFRVTFDTSFLPRKHFPHHHIQPIRLTHHRNPLFLLLTTLQHSQLSFFHHLDLT